MGIGACALGYADPDVNAKVKGLLTLDPCLPSIVGKRLTSLRCWFPCIHGLRWRAFHAVAARFALLLFGQPELRLGKIRYCSVVIMVGMTGTWLQTLKTSPNLDQQLLAGLSPVGVPAHLSGSAIPFTYNDVESFKSIVSNFRGDIAAVFMEPVRSLPPAKGFLEEIRDITEREGIILIFDEITSGFRVNPGGVHMTYGVHPDLAVFGKALGNGVPISALIGNEKTMSAIQDTFVSSTFGLSALALQQP